MDPETRLALIALLANRHDWKALCLVGEVILNGTYPADIFDGSSGDPGPEYIVALRNALARIEDKQAGSK